MVGLGISVWPLGEPGEGVEDPGSGPSGDALLMESGDFLLLESGDFLLLE